MVLVVFIFIAFSIDSLKYRLIKQYILKTINCSTDISVKQYIVYKIYKKAQFLAIQKNQEANLKKLSLKPAKTVRSCIRQEKGWQKEK